MNNSNMICIFGNFYRIRLRFQLKFLQLFRSDPVSWQVLDLRSAKANTVYAIQELADAGRAESNVNYFSGHYREDFYFSTIKIHNLIVRREGPIIICLLL